MSCLSRLIPWNLVPNKLPHKQKNKRSHPRRKKHLSNPIPQKNTPPPLQQKLPTRKKRRLFSFPPSRRFLWISWRKRQQIAPKYLFFVCQIYFQRNCYQYPLQISWSIKIHQIVQKLLQAHPRRRTW